MAVKSPAEAAPEFAQVALSLAPVIILGSGASAAHGVPGMWALRAATGETNTALEAAIIVSEPGEQLAEYVWDRQPSHQ